MMLLALVLTMLGVSDAMAQKIYRAELDKSMFKAWDGYLPGANVVEEPEAIDNGAATFNCENNLFKELDGGKVLFGNTNVYYLWYADLTGTKTISFKGTKGVQLRVLLNRPEPVEGGDAHGGTTVERTVTLDDNGSATLDVSDLEYVHLNCIKLGWSSAKGIIKEMVIEGTVKPVTGILSVINNGDAEGDDFASFPVSLDGPNNNNSANDLPEVVEGGVSGKCFKVTAIENPTETWHTQFYIKADEEMAKGSKWALKMSIKADANAVITTSAQGQPRAWKGDMGLGEIGVTSEWKDFSWSGEIGVDGFQSIAFDLSNAGGTPGNAGVSFYFDNIEFGYDLGGTNPLSNISVGAAADVICVNFNGFTNIAELVKTYGVSAPGGKKTVVFDNSVAKVTVDGVEQPILSVEGRDNGNLYIFLTEEAALIDNGNEVKVAFTNPVNSDRKLTFTTGKWEGEVVPDFSGLVADYEESLGTGDIYSYLWGAPALETIEPEAGSFNLPKDFKAFTLTFSQEVKVASVVAKLGNEDLTASAASGEEFAKVITLTRTSDAELSGSKDLVISALSGRKDMAVLEEEIVVNYSFGPVDVENAGEIVTLMSDNFEANGEDNKIPAGWKVVVGSTIRLSDGETDLDGVPTVDGGQSYSGNGARLFKGFGAGGDFTSALYFRTDYCEYGSIDGYTLSLEADKEYKIHFNAAKWKDGNMLMKLVVLNSKGEEVLTESVEPAPNVNGGKPKVTGSASVDATFTPAESGDYVLRFYACDANGNTVTSGMVEMLLGNVSVKFVPDVRGLEETIALNAALTSATEAYNDLAKAENEGRYDGEDLTALKNLIDEVSANKANYTAPSVYSAKVEELAAAVKVANEHKSACDSYDENIKKAVDIVADNAEKKFSKTETYLKLKATIEKYHASKTTVNEAEEGEDPVWKTTYAFDVLKDNAELKAANEDLTNAVNVGTSLFTEVALDADIQQGNCGIAVLVERNRLGARTLMSLGVEESDPLIQAVKNSVTDDDVLADAIKFRINSILNTELAKPENDVFGVKVDEFGDPITDEGTGEFVNKSYDMTVFIKNPNIYAVDGTKDLSEENIPGWTYPTNQKPGKFTAWGARNIEGLPEDCAFTTYWGTCRMEQTIEGLPAGLYVATLCGSDWSNRAGYDANPDKNETNYDVAGFVYCKTSDTAPVIEGEEEDRDLNFAATRTIVYGGQYNMDHALKLGYAEVLDDETNFVSTSADGEFFGIPVIDGKLTIGIHFGGDAQYFFQHARLTLVAPAENHDYAQDKETNIETAAAPKVRALQLYDLNGRRMIKANKGLQIVKKQMSDGSVRVEKVIVK